MGQVIYFLSLSLFLSHYLPITGFVKEPMFFVAFLIHFTPQSLRHVTTIRLTPAHIPQTSPQTLPYQNNLLLGTPLYTHFGG